eukprot:TRINITY_DN17686_c0_g3_i1.p1 TRINITY_DN17686_c0_g3~~TRINITY_DN17686_c0_g3_i1.p1  ORF type:complete len:137 (+),score=8.19 TRINITY_DN17686_c0_g3_i1:27-437(+)
MWQVYKLIRFKINEGRKHMQLQKQIAVFSPHMNTLYELGLVCMVCLLPQAKMHTQLCRDQVLSNPRVLLLQMRCTIVPDPAILPPNISIEEDLDIDLRGTQCTLRESISMEHCTFWESISLVHCTFRGVRGGLNDQ